jgi:hypothetical protein
MGRGMVHGQGRCPDMRMIPQVGGLKHGPVRFLLHPPPADKTVGGVFCAHTHRQCHGKGEHELDLFSFHTHSFLKLPENTITENPQTPMIAIGIIIAQFRHHLKNLLLPSPRERVSHANSLRETAPGKTHLGVLQLHFAFLT